MLEGFGSLRLRLEAELGRLSRGNESQRVAMFVLIMGVTGAGKTTIGKLLSAQLGWRFYDADDYHSAENIRKMASGVALTDEDRRPWLQQLHKLIVDHKDRNENGVLACSALKNAYRSILSADADVAVVYLKADPDVIRARLGSRRGHYMSQRLIESQFLDLQEPEACIILDAALPAEQIVSVIFSQLDSWPRS